MITLFEPEMPPDSEPDPGPAFPPVPVPTPKPRIALFLSTVCGLGYMPFAPGTFGSLASVGIYWAALRFVLGNSLSTVVFIKASAGPLSGLQFMWWLNVLVAGTGVMAAEIVSTKTGIKDPQFVVIDETSGQMLTYSLAFAPLNWKYLLLGFILFRLFDIWKPFPARQAESLPGGWGIMADDWVAGIYAALGLWIARAAGL
jgi:phosphatidylglycerophosphatase A